MTSDNPTADRLLNDARKKTASRESPVLAQVALVLGALGLIGGALIPGIGWGLGAVAAGTGVVSMQRAAAVKLAKIAVVIGVGAIMVATFRFTWFLAQHH